MRKLDLASALAGVRDNHGGKLTPEAVVEDATEASHPLHLFFTWDNEEAGHKYRLIEARALIRSVKIVVSTETKEYSAPAYVRDPNQGARQQGYIPLEGVQARSKSAHAVLAEEMGRIVSLIERAMPIAITLGLSKELEELLVRATTFTSRVREKVDA